MVWRVDNLAQAAIAAAMREYNPAPSENNIALGPIDAVRRER